MLRKALAGVLGMFVAVGFYALTGVLAPTPHELAHPAAMAQSDVRLPAAQIRVVDPTPVRLVIAAIDLDARIEARGLDANRSLDTPKDFHDVAWYRLGPRPGDPGNAVMNGHVNWWTGDAVFTHDPARDLATLTEWSLREGRLELRRTLRGMYLALYAGELVGRLIEEHDAHAAAVSIFTCRHEGQLTHRRASG